MQRTLTCSSWGSVGVPAISCSSGILRPPYSSTRLARFYSWRSEVSAAASPGGQVSARLFGSVLLNLLLRGNPFGASRPASARLPRQSASSFNVNEKTRPAVSVQERPSSDLKVLRSLSPPSL